MTIGETISNIGNALSGLANAVGGVFASPGPNDSYNYTDPGLSPGGPAYDLTPMEGIIGRSGPLQVGGVSNRDGFTLNLQSNNTADNGNAAKNAFWYVDRDGSDSIANVNYDGNARANLMVGTGGVNRINGGDGNDILLGREGGDSLFGGNGLDRMTGGVGNDFLYGGAGADKYHAGAGNDVVYAEAGDEVWTGVGSDTIRATNSRLGVVKNFDPDADRFDLADANEGHYNATNVSGLVIKSYYDGYIVGVDTGEGRFTLSHDSNGFSTVVTMAEAWLEVGSLAEAQEVKADLLSWDGAADWIV